MPTELRPDLASIKSARRVLEIFEFFAQHREPAAVGTIARALGYPQSSTSVMMRCLHEMKYMRHDPQRHLYHPTLRLALTSSWLREAHISGAELTVLMIELRDRTGGSVVLGIQNDIDLQYIQVVPAKPPVQLVMRIGQKRPLCRTAAGKMLLAQHSDQTVGGLVRRINARGEEHVVMRRLMSELDQIRRSGIAYSANAASPGAAVIAALVPGSELPMALGVGGAVEHIAAQRTMISERIRAALQEITPTRLMVDP